jgi:hypothetical protein
MAASEVRSNASVSTSAAGVTPVISAWASAAFAGLRPASTTVEPRLASALAVSSPSPLVAPVTTATRPQRSPTSAGRHDESIDGSVASTGRGMPPRRLTRLDRLIYSFDQ